MTLLWLLKLQTDLFTTYEVQILKITFGKRVEDKAKGDRSLVKAVIMVVLLPPSAMDMGCWFLQFLLRNN